MFGIKILTKRGLKKIEWNIEIQARNQALADLITLLRRKDRIFLEPVTLIGDGQTICDCVFLTAEAPAIIIKECGRWAALRAEKANEEKDADGADCD